MQPLNDSDDTKEQEWLGQCHHGIILAYDKS